MSEIDEHALEAAFRAFCACSGDTMRSIRAAILAYEQHRGRQEPVVTDEMIDAGADAASGHFAIDGDKGPFLRSDGWIAAYRAMRDLDASSQPADVGALRTAMAGAFEAGYSQGHIDAHQIKQNRCYSRRDEYLAALATSGGGE